MSDEEFIQGLWDAVELALLAYRAHRDRPEYAIRQMAVGQAVDQIADLVRRRDEESEGPWVSSPREIDP
jgi:hypothetical protein